MALRKPLGAWQPVAMTTDPTHVAERWTRALTEHDLEAAVSCFAPEYSDTAPARRGEGVIGQEEVRANFTALLESMPDLRAELLAAVSEGSTVWMEWRMSGTRADGTTMEFVGVNIFEVEGRCFTRGRIYTELVRDLGGITGQVDRMTRGQDMS